jgi:predicted DNA-binding transcriptional regulator YafY
MPRSAAPPEARLRAIEVLLLWEGRVTRGRLLELFSIHETMASRDISTFRGQFPDACVPHQAEKAYVRNHSMVPSLTEGRFADYQEVVGARPDSALMAGVNVATANSDATAISSHDFSLLHAALRTESAVTVTYRSLSNPVAHRRTLRPHTLIQAGPRWHVRAWCAKAEEFRDFNLGRLTEVSPARTQDLPGIDADVAWNTSVLLRLVPHSGLDGRQKKVVRDEYMQGATALRFDVRASMAGYVIQAFRAAVHPERQMPPDHLLMVDDPGSLSGAALWQG